MIVIGVDPDSKKHGIAIYKDGKLIELNEWGIVELIESAHILRGEVLFSIEDVASQSFVYARNVNSKAVQSNIAMKVGRCQQAQIEFQRMLDHLGFKYVLHKPQKGNWAKKKAIFERTTGWTKRSNEDTRSAAYFGFIEAIKKRGA
tara:strand:+ start:803 stop:1240 length:438 start_codon:yes stop_codon:yes gene_type:complete